MSLTPLDDVFASSSIHFPLVNFTFCAPSNCNQDIGGEERENKNVSIAISQKYLWGIIDLASYSKC